MMDKMYIISRITFAIVAAIGLFYSPKVIDSIGLFGDERDSNEED